jgi:hypothetical protein
MNLYVRTGDIYYFWREKKKLNNRASGSNADGLIRSWVVSGRPAQYMRAREIKARVCLASKKWSRLAI